MEFTFDCEKALSSQLTQHNFAILESNKLAKLIHPMHSSSLTFQQPNISEIIDKMGAASSKVNKDTSATRLLTNKLFVGPRSWISDNDRTEVLWQ